LNSIPQTIFYYKKAIPMEIEQERRERERERERDGKE
jgi:SH3-like domain-containing protein